MKWRKVDFRGLDAMVFDGRPKTFPVKYPYRYGIRHADNDWDNPITIEPYVLVNYWGTIALRSPLRVLNDGGLKLKHTERDTIRGRP